MIEMELRRARVLQRLGAIEKVLGRVENMCFTSGLTGWPDMREAMGELRDEIEKAERSEYVPGAAEVDDDTE